jgi:hypothetical protein
MSTPTTELDDRFIDPNASPISWEDMRRHNALLPRRACPGSGVSQRSDLPGSGTAGRATRRIRD